MSAVETPADITRTLVQLDTFIGPAVEALVRESATLCGEDIAGQESALHVRLLRLVVAERRRERNEAWGELVERTQKKKLTDRRTWNYEWNADWQPTEARLQHVQRQYPLHMRSTARTIMQIVNRQRLSDKGVPLDTLAGRAVRMVSFDEINEGRDEKPHDLARHLRLAGVYRGAPLAYYTRVEQRQYPADVTRYLDIYPVAQAIHDIPPIQGDEMPISDLFRELGTEAMGEEALKLSGVIARYRRLPGQGRGRCIRRSAAPQVLETLALMTTLQAGEGGAEELAAYMGLAIRSVREHINDADRARGRMLWPSGIGPRRLVLPSPVIADIFQRVHERTGRTFEVPDAFVQYRPPPQRRVTTPETFPELQWHTYAQLARTLYISPNDVNKHMLQFPPAPGQQETRPMPETGIYRPHLRPDKMAEIAQRVLGERLQRFPNTQLNIRQIAILAQRHPSEVAARLKHAGITRTTNPNAVTPADYTYHDRPLREALALFGVRLP